MTRYAIVFDSVNDVKSSDKQKNNKRKLLVLWVHSYIYCYGAHLKPD